MPDVTMPRLSESMQEGTILRWLKADGDAVRLGDGLAEIETDKATLTFEADAEGVLTIVALEGETLPVGALIARLGEVAHDAPTAVGDRRAREPGEATPAKGEVTVQELGRVQRTVARRYAEARAIVPDHVLQADVDMEACADLRTQLAARAGGAAPTHLDIVVKACALALREVPRANAAYRDGRFELYARANVGVAIPAQDALVVPTVFDADTKRLDAIAAETRALAERARAGTITPPELSGATFTVWSLDEPAVARFAAIITPPQAGALALGSVQQRAVVRDGAVCARHTATLTLTADHRILYATEAARFLARVRALLEQPLSLALSGDQQAGPPGRTSFD